MNSIITFLNATGKTFIDFSAPMLIQSSVLIIVLLVADLLLRKKVRAVFRYCIWMLVLLKLVLPVTLSAPTGLGHWFGDKIDLSKMEIAKPVDQVGATDRKIKYEIPAEPALSNKVDAAGNQIKSAEWSREFVEAEITPVLENNGVVAAVSLSWQGFAILGWLAAVIAMVLLLVQRMFFVRGLIAQSKDAAGEMVDIFQQCCEQMQVRRRIALKLSPVASSPSVCGLFRPTILIPQDLPDKLKAEDLRSILLHELAHIKRGDLQVSMVQTILQIAYFYNPLLWVANAIIRNVREQAVDEMVLVAMGEKAEDYPETLLNISRLTFSRPVLSLRLIGVVESKKALSGRIKHILSRPFPKTAKLGIIGLLVVIVAGAVLLPMANAEKAKDQAPAKLMAKQSQFAVTLENGVSVELVGVCKHPVAGERWWRPDGQLLAEPAFDDSGSSVHANRNEAAYDFAVSFKAIPADTSARIITDPSSSSTGGSLFSSVSLNGENLQKYADGRLVETMSHIATLFDKKRKTCTVKVGVGTGPWQNDFEAICPKTSNTTWGSSGGGAKGGVAFSSPFEQNGKTLMTISHSIDADIYDVRFIVVDKDGNEIKSSRVSSNGADSFVQITATFDVPVNNIETFRIQTRKYHWVEFKNVSLKTGFETDVQIEIDSEPSGVNEIVAAEFLFDFGDAMETSERVGQMLYGASKRMAELKITYEKKNWVLVDENAKQVRDVFRRLVDAIKVDEQAAIQAKYLAMDGRKWTKEQMELVGLFNIKWILSRIAEREKGQHNFYQLIHDIANFSDELHDAIRDKEMNVVSGFYNRLVHQWGYFSKLKSIDDLLHKSSQAKRKDLTVRRPDLKVIRKRTIAATQMNIRKKLQIFNGRLSVIEEDLTQVENHLNGIRQRTEFSGLGDASDTHPVTVRLTRLEEQRDNCKLEISQLEVRVEHLRREIQRKDSGVDSKELKKAEENLVVLNRKLETLHEMVTEARNRKRAFYLLCADYQKLVSVRDERRASLNNIKSQIEKLSIEHDEAGIGVAEKGAKTAKTLKIIVYEGGDEPVVSINIPLTALKIANGLLPPKVKAQMLSRGIFLESILMQINEGLEPTTLLDVKDGGEHIIISLE